MKREEAIAKYEHDARFRVALDHLGRETDAETQARVEAAGFKVNTTQIGRWRRDLEIPAVPSAGRAKTRIPTEGNVNLWRFWRKWHRDGLSLAELGHRYRVCKSTVAHGIAYVDKLDRGER